jgi:hypothetical protein
MSARSRALVALVLFGACGPSAKKSGPAPGTAGGPCYTNGSCDLGLECDGDVCVVQTFPDAGPRPDARPGLADAPFFPGPDAPRADARPSPDASPAAPDAPPAAPDAPPAAPDAPPAAPDAPPPTPDAPPAAPDAPPPAPDAPTGDGTGSFTWAWNLTVGGVDTLCSDAPVVTGNVRLAATSRATGATVTDEVDCILHQETTPRMAAGDYDVVALLLDTYGWPLAQTVLGKATITAGTDTDLGSVILAMPAHGGRVLYGWSVTKTGAASTCADVGATRVEVTLTAFADNAQTVDNFICSDGIGESDLVVADTYLVNFRLYDATGHLLGSVNEGGGVDVSADTEVAAPDVVFKL